MARGRARTAGWPCLARRYRAPVRSTPRRRARRRAARAPRRRTATPRGLPMPGEAPSARARSRARARPPPAAGCLVRGKRRRWHARAGAVVGHASRHAKRERRVRRPSRPSGLVICRMRLRTCGLCSPASSACICSPARNAASAPASRPRPICNRPCEMRRTSSVPGSHRWRACSAHLSQLGLRETPEPHQPAGRLGRRPQLRPGRWPIHGPRRSRPLPR